jgi:hypothetical protein
MGYAVYEDHAARDYGVQRWAGYGVPAICDFATCEAKIDRGMGYRCEEVYSYVEDPETEEEREVITGGCNLHFCGEHESHNKHKGSTPKPDTAEWVDWLLTDESWQQWRDENAELVTALTSNPEPTTTKEGES